MSISTSVDEKTMEKIDTLAARSGLTRGGWARAALTEAAAESACYAKTTTRTNPQKGNAAPQSSANLLKPSDGGFLPAVHPPSLQAG